MQIFINQNTYDAAKNMKGHETNRFHALFLLSDEGEI